MGIRPSVAVMEAHKGEISQGRPCRPRGRLSSGCRIGMPRPVAGGQLTWVITETWRRQRLAPYVKHRAEPIEDAPHCGETHGCPRRPCPSQRIGQVKAPWLLPHWPSVATDIWHLPFASGSYNGCRRLPGRPSDRFARTRHDAPVACRMGPDDRMVDIQTGGRPSEWQSTLMPRINVASPGTAWGGHVRWAGTRPCGSRPSARHFVAPQPEHRYPVT